MDAKKKPSLALVIAGAKARGGDDAGDDDAPPDSMAPDSDESDADYTASVDELFDALKNDDRDAFHDAFKAAVMSCSK